VSAGNIDAMTSQVARISGVFSMSSSAFAAASIDFVRPSGIAPAARMRATAGASCAG
jgi:hypothetical protein